MVVRGRRLQYKALFSLSDEQNFISSKTERDEIASRKKKERGLFLLFATCCIEAAVEEVGAING